MHILVDDPQSHWTKMQPNETTIPNVLQVYFSYSQKLSDIKTLCWALSNPLIFTKCSSRVMLPDPEAWKIQRCNMPEKWINIFASYFFYLSLLPHEILCCEKFYSSLIYWICTWYSSPDVRKDPYSYLFCSKLATRLLTLNSYHLSWKYIRVLVAKQIFSKRWIKAYGEEKPTKFSLPI